MPNNDPPIRGRTLAIMLLALLGLMLLAGHMDAEDAKVDEQYRCAHGLPGRDGPARLSCDEG